jgi:hypothetical protein
MLVQYRRCVTIGGRVRPQRPEICRKNRSLASIQFIAGKKFIGGVVDTGEQFIGGIVDTVDKF